MNKKEIWSKILHFAITVLTAISTNFSILSCMN
ncbi:MAG: smalltalk protein [Bacteroidaceae bacterium]|nr:smalltalk protein [Bacteroidaceae bacterium]